MATSPLAVERDGHVALVWLDDPDRRNAFGAEFFTSLPEVMGELGDDTDVRAVVLAGRGPHFSAGLDLLGAAEELGTGDGVAANRRVHGFVRRLQAAIESVAACPTPVIAVVHGHCIGAALDLVCACDIRVAAADAVFSVRETRLAMVADLGTLQRLPAIVGRGHAAEMALTGKDVGADRAGEIGLVNAVLPDVDSALQAGRALAHEIAGNSPLAVEGTKAVLRAGERRDLEEGLEHVALWNAAYLRSDDLTEALTAFAERRPPRYGGA